MKAETIGGLIFGVIASATALATLYISLSAPNAKLNAEITKQTSYLPPQFEELMNATQESVNSDNLSKFINENFPQSNFEQNEKLFKEIRTRVLRPWNAPFAAGINRYETMVFLSLSNDGDAIAKDIYIDLPQDALLMIEDDKKEIVKVSELTRRYKISSIRQAGHYRLWAWFPTSYSKLDEYAIRIGSDQQTASISYSKEFNGMAARVAEYYLIFIYLAVCMVFSFIYWLYEILKPGRQTE